jgi:4-hydroxybenzoate polyprenyltransferase
VTTIRDWAELLRVSALFTVPGDVLAGTAAAGRRPGARTVLAVGASLCLYEAGMALNDWADRAEDAAERPHRPIPSGRISPAQALTAAAGLTAAGIGLAWAAGRPAALCATLIAGTVWGYDLYLKRTPAGPAAMAAARGLDVLLGAVAAEGSPRVTRRALASATALSVHTYAVTMVSRTETQGGSSSGPAAALGATAALGALVGARGRGALASHKGRMPYEFARIALAGAYVATAAKPFLHSALNPSPELTQRAVGGGIRAMIPLQAALAARSGALVPAALLAGLGPTARRLARKVSVT